MTNPTRGGSLKGWKGAQLLTGCQTWPSAEYGKRRGMRVILDWHDSQTEDVAVLPAIWQSRVATSAFWSVHVAKYGTGALQCPRLFLSEEDRQRGWLPVRWARRYTAVPELRGEQRKVVADMRARRRRWRVLRPWCVGRYVILLLEVGLDADPAFAYRYQTEYDWWKQTPYSLYHPREHVEDFLTALSTRDEELAMRSIESLIRIRNHKPWFPARIEASFAQSCFARLADAMLTFPSPSTTTSRSLRV